MRTRGPRSRDVAWIACAMVLVAGARAASAGGAREWRASAMLAPRAILDYPTDGHGPSDKHALAAGVDGELVWRAPRAWRYGVGARTTTWSGDGRAWLAQELALVAFGDARLELGGGDAIDVALGVGLTAAVFPGNPNHTGPALLSAGPCAELTATYAHPLRPGLALTVGVGLRVALPRMQTGTDYQRDADGAHAAIPILVGLSWR